MNGVLEYALIHKFREFRKKWFITTQKNEIVHYIVITVSSKEFDKEIFFGKI